jgi:hypothetical protein
MPISTAVAYKGYQRDLMTQVEQEGVEQPWVRKIMIQA